MEDVLYVFFWVIPRRHPEENIQHTEQGESLKSKMEDVLVKLNVGLLWLKLHSTKRGLFLLAHWTWN
jgi:hypothetical protein